MAGVQIDGVNNKIDFDDDLDTSISANTDDTLVFEIAGATDFTMTANTFTAASGSTIAAQALTATSIVSTGDVTLTGASNNAVWDSSNNSLDFADSAQLRFGAGADLKIFHDGSDSQIVDSGTGSLKIAASAVQIMNAAGTENILLGTQDGAVTIYNNNIVHFNTSATESVFNEGSADIDFRVESNGNDHMLFVDGGNNRVGVGTAPDLGVGLHIRTADSGASVDSNADELIVEGSGSSGISILSGTGNEGAIKWGDSGDNNIGFISYDHAGNDMYIGVNADTRVKVHDNGVAAFNNGVALGVGTANTASNVLDDYEEGTFTAAFTVASGSVAVNGNHDTLSYIKIGNVVHTFGQLVSGSVSSPSGAISVNLPFAVSNLTESAGDAWQPIFAFLNGSGITNGNYMVIAEVEEGTSLARLYYKPDHHLANNLSEAIGSGSDIWLRLTYRTG